MEKLLPDDANIVKFWRDYCQVPMPGDDW
ncbi:MAG: hypothetical protein ACYC0V_13240 [Armatimonadota bacterium]